MLSEMHLRMLQPVYSACDLMQAIDPGTHFKSSVTRVQTLSSLILKDSSCLSSVCCVKLRMLH